MSWLDRKRITVTGGAGFLGTQVVKKLRGLGCQNIFVPRKKDYNLVDNEGVKRLYRDSKPDVVIHLAATTGGLGVISGRPGEFFYSNLMMGAQMIEGARLSGVEKFVAIGSVCAYPKTIPIPFKEEDLWKGYPEDSNAAYGLAKKMTLVQCQAYRQQYGFNGIHLLLINLYGPGDNFDPASSHVIPALIKKCTDAVEEGKEEIVAWGTGRPTREFVYVEDAAEGIILAAERYDKPEPANLGSGLTISIGDLASLIARLTGFRGRITWDSSRPDGQLMRFFDSSRAEREFGFVAKTDFEEGLRKTIDWYNGQRARGLLR